MNLRRDWKEILSALATAIITFSSIQEILKNYGVALIMPANYVYPLALVGLTAFPLWLGYEIHAWRTRHALGSEFGSKEDGIERLRELLDEPPETAKSLSPSQFEYRARVRGDLLRVIGELYHVSPPRPITFPSWNDVGIDARRQNIGRKQEWGAIETFSDSLNRRNGYVSTRTVHGLEDARFLELNNECIMNYEMARSFLDADKPAREEAEIPTILVIPADTDSARLKEFQVKVTGGVETYPACFYCVTIKNVSGPTVHELEGYFELSSLPDHERLRSSVYSGPLLFIMSSGADHLTIYDEKKRTAKQFREDDHGDALRITLLNNKDGKPALRRLRLHQGDKGKTFVLLFGIKGYSVLTIADYLTRPNVSMPCEFRLDLYLSGDTLPEQRVASFLVEATEWDKMRVKPLPS